MGCIQFCFIKSEVLHQDSGRAKFWETRTKPLGRFIAGNGTKVMLLYTPYFDDMPWSFAKEGSDDERFLGSKKCVVTYSRKDYLRRDAVVFHGRTRYNPSSPFPSAGPVYWFNFNLLYIFFWSDTLTEL